MSLNWNEIKSRELLFSKTWADASNEDSEAKPFWIAFFEIFGITDKRVATFELNVKKLGVKAPQCMRNVSTQFASSTLACLCTPLAMATSLLKIHQKLHAVVDTAYPAAAKSPKPCCLHLTTPIPIQSMPSNCWK
jgi:hypothetical protein